jgi:cyclopropane fatty-acyl-phospholipid synthase-like methyltransferase
VERELLNDYWVDGHFITARNEEHARAEVRRLYDYEPEQVRPWTDDDQDDLDALYEDEDDLWAEEQQAIYDEQWGDPLDLPSYAY